MIRISGTLNVKSIKGSRGAFSVGELTSAVGNFKVKDQILDQFSEGSYEGEFLVAHIYPASYVHYGKVITEIRAKLAEIILPQGEEKPLPEQSVPQEPDPVEEVQPAAAPVPAEVPPTALTEEEAKDFALFGAELYDAVARRDAIKLDPTVDRLKFRAQRDRLKGLGYRFDAAHQAWGFEESSCLMIGKLAKELCGVELPVTVLESRAGFYLGTQADGFPVSRESEEYFANRELAQAVLKSGNFTQRMNP